MTRIGTIAAIAVAAMLGATNAAAGAPQADGVPEGILYYESVAMMSSAAAVNQAADGRDGETLELAFETLGRQFDLKLERHNPFAPGATVQWIDDTGVVEEPATGMFFRGRVEGDPASWVRITLRGEALAGVMSTSGELYFLEPAARFFGDEAAGETLAYRLSDTDTDWIAGTCAATAPSLPQTTHRDTARAAHRALHELLGDAAATVAGAAALKQADLGMVADFEYFTEHGASSADDLAEIVNAVDGIYQAELGVTVRILTTVVFTTEEDPFGPTTVPQTLLFEFSDWKQVNDDTPGQALYGADLAHLMTGRDLDGSTIGIAYVAGLCSSSEGAGVDSDFTTSLSLMTLLMAHEMGHNFGAFHDNQAGSPCASSPGTFIMNPVLSGALQQQFSPCSKTFIDPEVDGASCLADAGTLTPTPTPTSTPTPTTPPNAAVFVSQNVPGSMAAGQQYSVSVTMRNTGAATWTAANSYRLGALNDATTWGVTRVMLGANDSIAPGQQKTFTWTVTAPASTGTFNFQWRMVRDGVAWFGDTTPNVAVAVSGPNAAFVTQSVPSVMNAGQSYNVSLTMWNTGGTTWTAATSHRLGAFSASWGMVRVYLNANDSIGPGQQKTFSWMVTAPTTPGTYGFQWMMVRDGVAWFGAASPNTSVSVVVGSGVPHSSAFIGQNVPSSMTAGQPYNVSVTMQNTGTATWTGAASYRLGSQNPQGNMTWGSSRISLAAGESIGPGQQKTFSWTVTAPTTAGTYNFQWRMVQDGVAWFGATTTNVVVTVSGASGPNAAFVTQSVPSSMTAGQPVNVSVTMQNTGATTWTAATSYRLGATNPNGNTRWGMNRVFLSGSDSIAPGGQKTFSWTVTAPTTPGTYNFQWRMVQEGVAWFGATSTNIAVTVNP